MSKPINDKEQMELSLEAAKNAIGSATMTMDPDQLRDAARALQVAKAQYEHMRNKLDQSQLTETASMIDNIENQLNEAQH
jgi:hypothetical protein